MTHTKEQLEEALEYWENGNKEDHPGLCSYFSVEHNISFKATLGTLDALGYKMSHDGYICNNVYVAPKGEAEPRVELIKHMIKAKEEQL